MKGQMLMAVAVMVLCLDVAQASAQAKPTAQGGFLTKIDVGLNFTYKMTKSPAATNGYYIDGGSADVAYTPERLQGFGVAADFNGAYRSNIYPGINLRQNVYVAGPRYTLRRANATVYAEALFGLVKVSDTQIALNQGLYSGATNIAAQYGAGMNLRYSRRIAIRLIEADYVNTHLPNLTTSRQNALRLSMGISFHL